MTKPGEHCPTLFCVVCGAAFRVHPYRLSTAVVCCVRCGQVRRGWQRAAQRYAGKPHATPYRKHGGRRVHRSVAEAAAGRALGPDDVVHHVDGNKRNNRPDNLRVMSVTDHTRLHNEMAGHPGRKDTQ